MSRGDDSFENRSHIADSYVQMSSILLDHETEGDKIVLIGDLDFAEQCAESAYNLMRASDGAVAAYNRAEAEAQYGRVMALRDALKAQPDRFVLRPRYGPFTVSVLPRDQTKQ